MPDEIRHESQDLEDFEVDDSTDTLDGPPGDDPLDRGVVPPERWSAGIRFGTTEEEQEEGESLDQLLAEEEPDVGEDEDVYEDDIDEDIDEADIDEGIDDGDVDDQDMGDEDVDGVLLDDGPDPRAGRLVAEDEGAHPDDEEDLVARDVGIDGGGATAEEAAMHVVEEDDYDIRSE
jgi:Family of unknown function (DUF5709)